MLGRYIEVATAQGQDEIAWLAQATESEAIASKDVGRVFKSLPGTNGSKRHNKVFPKAVGQREKGLTQSPLDCLKPRRVTRQVGLGRMESVTG